MATRKKRRTTGKKRPVKRTARRKKSSSSASSSSNDGVALRNYKEAFLLQYNLILMGFFVLLAFLLWSPLPLLLGLGLEIVYLALVPGSQVFGRYLAMRDRQDKAAARVDALEERLDELNPWQRQNYERASELIKSIEANFTRQADISPNTIDKLETLRERLLWLMELSNVYDHYLGGINERHLQQEVEKVHRQLDNSSGRLRQSLQERLSVLDKRRMRLGKVRENKEVIKNQIATIMDILHLMQESSMTMRNPQGISQQLDDLLLDVESTEAAVSELETMNDKRSTDAFDQELEKALEQAHMVVHQR